MAQRWPEVLWIVRHGESAGNVAAALARAQGAPIIDLSVREIDVPLSPRGQEQAAALGRWFASRPESERPTVILCSPYVRAIQTAEAIRGASGARDVPICLDERLREREFGILDRFTRRGIREQHPEQAAHLELLGKFYHRAPGGESWCDVILRLRSALDTISLHHAGERVLIVCHQVVVLCMRYLLERMTEQQILAIDAQGDVANCGVTTYVHDPDAGRHGDMVLSSYNFVAPLERRGVEVRRRPDEQVGVK
jgi:2,3-bisphosphoglycerate-dependent phosphoglycerate mutase